MAAETVLITGASSGIGLELARLFAADHANLVLVARSEEKLQNLAGQLQDQHGVRVQVLAKDLCVPGIAQEIFDELSRDGILVDVLVNNAGFGARGPTVQLDVQRQLDMIQVNVTALTHLTRLFLPAMLERGRGGILNVASTAAFQPGPYMAVYYATKAYVLSLTEALTVELAGRGVRVSCLAPGPTATGFGTAANTEGARLLRLGVMDASTVAVAGYRGFRRRGLCGNGQTIIIPGLLNKMGALLVRLTPRVVTRRVVGYLQAER